jgi:hypothetical protein
MDMGFSEAGVSLAPCVAPIHESASLLVGLALWTEESVVSTDTCGSNRGLAHRTRFALAVAHAQKVAQLLVEGWTRSLNVVSGVGENANDSGVQAQKVVVRQLIDASRGVDASGMKSLVCVGVSEAIERGFVQEEELDLLTPFLAERAQCFDGEGFGQHINTNLG